MWLEWLGGAPQKPGLPRLPPTLALGEEDTPRWSAWALGLACRADSHLVVSAALSASLGNPLGPSHLPGWSRHQGVPEAQIFAEEKIKVPA